jgi:integrase
MTCLNKMVRIATGRRIINHHPFSGYSAKRPKPTQKYVPPEELKRLMETPLKSRALEVTRDMSVFSCFTGLCHIDLYSLARQQIERDDEGFLWLNVSRQKTGNESRIFLLESAMRLIEKYAGTGCGDRVFPVKRCSLMNRDLKRIAIHCGIERRLTFHLSRHTFATTVCLNSGVSMETLSKMMGHSSMHSTQIYGEITSQKVGGEMKKLAKRTGKKRSKANIIITTRQISATSGHTQAIKLKRTQMTQVTRILPKVNPCSINKK